MAKIRWLGDVATVKDQHWTSSNSTLSQLLNTLSEQVPTGPWMPDQDNGLAEGMVDLLGLDAELIEENPTQEMVKDRVY